MEREVMEVEKPAMTYDEASMERSKGFVLALQELKDLRSQLYSAAEYCERSYHRSEQKQKVLDNLKDYAVRALVNAVDHLGTVAYKLTNLLEQNTMDISSADVKITSLNQQLLTCQTYVDKEGLKKQQLLATVSRHHKHYTLPNFVNKKVHFSPHGRNDTGQQVQAKTHLYPLGTPAAKTLSWDLASDTKPSLKGSQYVSLGIENSNGSGGTAFSFTSLVDTEMGSPGRMNSYTANSRLATARNASSVAVQTLDITPMDALEGSRPTTPFRSFESPSRNAMIVRIPTRSKSIFSAFFVKQKTQKLKTTLVS